MKEAYLCIVDVQPGETCINHGQPSWATWKNIEPYLPPVFYDIHGGVSSLRGLFSWMRMDPITTQDGHIHGYEQIEIVVLACGLGLRGLRACIAWWDYQDVPAYVKDAEYHEILITELSYLIEDTIKGYEYVHNFLISHSPC